jgi:membrane-associated phospholipid phosphatase
MRIRAVAAFVLAGAGARAAGDGESARLRWDPRVDVPVTVGGGAAWIVSELGKKKLAPASCHWCASNGLDDGLRDALRWPTPDAADLASNVAGFAVMPLAMLGGSALVAAHDDRLREAPVDMLLAAESAVLAADVNQTVKVLVGRERPLVHALAPEDKPHTAQPADNNLSFYSGHTTLAFSLAASAGTIATMRRYRLWPVVWAAGMTLATGIGYLRIAADKHYFTDVATGAVAGGAMGFAIPYFFHAPGGPRVVAGPTQGGSTILVSGVW